MHNPDGGTPIVIPACSGGGSPSLPGDRLEAEACPATADYLPAGTDVTCATLADCQDAGVASGAFKACRGEKCSIDGCLTDSDCPTGQACACASQVGGSTLHTNTCVAAQCRVDADCGRSVGICSPTRGYCGGLIGYYCHSEADTCITDADCCEPSASSCQYQPELGHFACQAPVGCSG